MEASKQDRLLELFFRGLRGEDLYVQRLAREYEVSTKSISRTINDLKAFLADHRELVGNTEFNYSHQKKCYRLYMDGFLTNEELFALVEVLLGSRAFSKMELLTVIDKMKTFTTVEDRPKLDELIRKEIYHYSEVKHDCESVTQTLWQLVNCIHERREISIDYYRSDRALVTHRIRPISVLFTDYYFYLIAFLADKAKDTPTYFRLDRINRIVEHRKQFDLTTVPDFDEGLLRKRSLFMFPGQLRCIRFEFYGPSVQAVLDKIPTAKVIDRTAKGYLIEAEVYGDGIKMWLLSQGAWVKVIAPDEFVRELAQEIELMRSQYSE